MERGSALRSTLISGEGSDSAFKHRHYRQIVRIWSNLWKDSAEWQPRRQKTGNVGRFDGHSKPRPNHRAGFSYARDPRVVLHVFFRGIEGMGVSSLFGAGKCGSYDRLGGDEWMSGLNNSEVGDVIGIYRETVHELYRFVSRRSGGSRELAEEIT